jgi:hypothetical protein
MPPDHDSSSWYRAWLGSKASSTSRSSAPTEAAISGRAVPDRR